MVCKSFEFLSVISYLSHKGYRIPEDISVICRNDDGFMPFLVPSPARYETSAELRARRIMKLVNQVVSGGAVSKSSVRIMPNFIPGNTVAPPRE
jgi:LacI family transcriptional regulator